MQSRAKASALALLITAAVVLVPTPAVAANADGWGTPELIVSDARGQSYHAEVAVDADGRGLAVWEMSDGFTNEVQASRYVPGEGWSFPERLVRYYYGGAALDPDVGVDAMGNGLAVWQQDWGGQYQIAMASYVPGLGWGPARQVADNLSADQRDPDVAVGQDGSAAVVWSQCCDPGWQVWGNVFDPQTGWAGAARINLGSTVTGGTPRVGVDLQGGAVAVWIEDASTTSSLNGSHYAPAAGWSAPAPVETDAVSYVAHAALAVDGTGAALAVWERTNGTTDVTANRFIGGAWETAQVVGASPMGPSEAPRVAMDGAGNGMAVWHSYTAAKNTIIARTFDAADGWGGMRELENVSYDEGRASPDVAMDSAGNALAVWVEGGPIGYSIEGARYSAAAGWSRPNFAEDVSQSAGHDYNVGGPPRVVLGTGGRGLLTWMGEDSVRWNVWGNSITWPDTTAPTLSVTSPAVGATTNRSMIHVAGTTEPGARVSVNGLEATVAGDGSFALDVALVTGTNFVEVAAWDAAGNTATFSRSVTFVDPVPRLETQLGAAQVALEAAAAQVQEAQARLDNLTNSTNVTQGQLESAQANLTAAQAHADAVGSLAASLSSQLVEARALLNQTRVELAASQTELAAARSEFNASNGTAPAPPGADLGPAIAVGLAGVALGGAGLAMGVNSARRAKKPPAP